MNQYKQHINSYYINKKINILFNTYGLTQGYTKHEKDYFKEKYFIKTNEKDYDDINVKRSLFKQIDRIRLIETIIYNDINLEYMVNKNFIVK